MQNETILVLSLFLHVIISRNLQLAVRSKVYACGRSIFYIAGSNPDKAWDIRLLCL